MDTNDEIDPEVLDAVDALHELEDELFDATDGWTSSTVVRTYASSDEGDEDLQDELELLGQHGYEASLQTAEDSHIHVGRLLLTGGLSVFAGRSGIRSEGRVTVTYRRKEGDPPRTANPPKAVGDLVADLERLAKLRDAGHLTNEEFDAAKAQILGRR
ncbi:MAG: SHOCT domain-containing protein [Chloroflexota bacterium]|nr:MAG: SHOCT domain-containing protein [Chloroflexota bacterium]